MRGCDIFHLDNTQANVKLGNTPSKDGTVINVHSCAFEGGYQALIIGANSIARGKFSEGGSSAMNAIIDGVISVMNYAGHQAFYTVASGVTIRNNLCIVAGQAKINYGNAFKNFVEVKAMYGAYQESPVQFDANIVGNAPVRIYNNTMRVDRTYLQNSSVSGVFVEPVLLYEITQGGAPKFTNVIEENNLTHMPRFQAPYAETSYAPVSDVALWQPRTAGWRPIVARHPGKLLGQDVPDGGTYFQPYWTLSDGVTQLARAHIKEGSDKHQLVVQGVGNGWMSLDSGLFEMRFDEAGVTITNRSGVTWPASAGYGPVLDMSERSPLQTGYAMPESAVKDTRPLPGSAALGAALNGDVSYMDITLQDRPEPPSMGAWEAE